MPDNSAGTRQRSTGYASDVTNISATTSQVGLSDSPRPSLILTRNRSSHNTASRSRPGIRGEPVGAFQVMEDSTVEGIMGHEERLAGGSSVKGSEKDSSAMRQPKFKAGQVKEALFRPISSGSVSSTPQPLSSDTPAAQQSAQSDSDAEAFHQALRSPRFQGGGLEGHGDRSQTGLDRIWSWISTRGLAGNNTDYDLLESGGSVKMEGDVKHKHQSSGRRKKTKRSRDAKGRLLGPELGAKGNFTKKRLWRRIWTAMLARPYRSLVSQVMSVYLRPSQTHNRRISVDYIPGRTWPLRIFPDDFPYILPKSRQSPSPMAEILCHTSTQLPRSNPDQVKTFKYTR